MGHVGIAQYQKLNSFFKNQIIFLLVYGHIQRFPRFITKSALLCDLLNVPGGPIRRCFSLVDVITFKDRFHLGFYPIVSCFNNRRIYFMKVRH